MQSKKIYHIKWFHWYGKTGIGKPIEIKNIIIIIISQNKDPKGRTVFTSLVWSHGGFGFLGVMLIFGTEVVVQYSESTKYHWITHFMWFNPL